MPNPESRKGVLFVVGALVVLLICALSYHLFDRAAINYFLAFDPTAVWIFRLLTQVGDSLYSLLPSGLFALGGYLWQRRKGVNQALERWTLRAQFLFVSVAASGLLVDLIKFVCGRARPVKLLTENLYGFYLLESSSKMTSFPSGHSNTAAAIGLVLWYLWPKSWPLGLLLTGGVMLSRVVLLKHYPSDTLAGAYVAVVTTYYIYCVFRRRFPAVFGGGER